MKWGLLVDDFLLDGAMVFAEDCSVKYVSECFGHGFDTDNYSPKRLLYIFSDFDIRTSKGDAGALLNLYLSCTENRRLIVGTTVILV